MRPREIRGRRRSRTPKRQSCCTWRRCSKRADAHHWRVTPRGWIGTRRPSRSADRGPGRRRLRRAPCTAVVAGRTLWIHEQRAATMPLFTTGGGLVFGDDVNDRFRALDEPTGTRMPEVATLTTVTRGVRGELWPVCCSAVMAPKSTRGWPKGATEHENGLPRVVAARQTSRLTMVVVSVLASGNRLRPVRSGRRCPTHVNVEPAAPGARGRRCSAT